MVRRISTLAALVLAAWLCFAVRSPAPATAADPVRHETAAERLHRQGVHCMEVIERDDCAIESFEALLDERTTQRELVTDGMLRLIKLYRRDGRHDEIKPLLRRFWDVGMKLGSRGHVPYSTRFVPSELNILLSLDPKRIARAPITRRLGTDARDYMFTCDAARRRDIEARLRWKRAKKRAKKEGRPVHEVVYEELDEQRERQANYERRAASSDPADRRRSAPLFAVAVCPVARALGDADTLGWTRMTGLLNHQDFSKSIAIAQIPDLDAKLARAEREKAITRVGPHRWLLSDLEFHGEPVHLARLDLDELTVATPPMLDRVAKASDKKRRRMNRELSRLVDRVPPDTGMFVALNQAALRELGMSGFKRSTRSVLEALLPKPKGMQIAAVFGDDLALFTRMPTDNPIKGRMLVSLAQNFIDGRAEKDPEAERWLRNLDVAEAEDRRALLATYLLSARDIERFVLD
jgi:hypothetical protein